MVRTRPPTTAITPKGFESTPRLNWRVRQRRRLENSALAVGMTYEMYNNTALPAANTRNAPAYKVQAKANPADTQIAALGFPFVTSRICSEKGKPPSRAKANNIREQEVTPARPHK